MSLQYQSLLGTTTIDVVDTINADQINANILTANQFIYPNGARDGYVFTSDPMGVASWQPDPNVNLLGDVSAPPRSNIVNFVGGSSAAKIHASEILDNDAAPLNPAEATIKRNNLGELTATR